ncbi:MAG: hypothetical protein JWP34_3590 [Massilia sp.]|nr:hypothetical protein [Massilia sp.]
MRGPVRLRVLKYDSDLRLLATAKLAIPGSVRTVLETHAAR